MSRQKVQRFQEQEAVYQTLCRMALPIAREADLSPGYEDMQHMGHGRERGLEIPPSRSGGCGAGQSFGGKGIIQNLSATEFLYFWYDHVDGPSSIF